MSWQDIETAPRDGTIVKGRCFIRVDRYTGKLKYETHKTLWGKTSHVPLYGWIHGKDVENFDLWFPEQWRPL